MTLVLYAVIPAEVTQPDDLGVLRRPHVAVVHREEPAPAAAAPEAVLAFGQTIERIAERGPALPIRFGTTVSGLDELHRIAEEHEGSWATRLLVVAGHCELIVHVRVHGGAERATHRGLRGREYLRRRAMATHARSAAHDGIREVLGARLREHRVLGIGDVDRLAALVPSAAADEVRADLERWAAETPDIELSVTGPWPAFSFCEEPA